MTWTTPILTSSEGVRASTRSFWYVIDPFVTSPRSAPSRFEMDLSVVDFPAPLAPSRVTMPPSGTSRDTPLSTRITWS